MTAYETHQFTTSELNKIANTQRAVQSGAVKEKDLPAEFAAYLTPENKANLVAANKKSHAVLMEELKQWY